MTLNYVELFAGVGGLSLGLDAAGFHCLAHVEYAEFPRRVLRARWPNTPLHGDVSEVHGGGLVREYGQIDVLSGGSPCQGMSVAGRREGLEDDRSILFYEQIRIWGEILDAQDSDCLLLWENVDGARSVSEGRDFAAVLSTIVGATIPVPTDGWRTSGVAAGATGVAAWRVLDAEYFGVAQRRSRVFVVGTRGGSVDPAEILSVSEGVRRYPAPRRIARQTTATDSGTSAEEGGERALIFDWQSGDDVRLNVNDKRSSALHVGQVPAVLAFDTLNQDDTGQIAHTLRVGHGEGRPVVLAIDGEGNATPDVSGALSAHHSTHNRGAVLAFSAKDSGQDVSQDVSPTLRAGQHVDGNANGGVMPAVFAFDLAQITSKTNRTRVSPDLPASTLNTAGQMHVAFNETGHEKWSEEDVAGSLNAHEAKEAHTIVMDHDVASTLNGHQRMRVDAAMAVTQSKPRRLMPIECERLMGWPDDWTNVPDEKGKPPSDSVRYRACGNGVASPVAHWIGWRMRQVLGI